MNLDLKSTNLSFTEFEEFVRALLNSRPTIPISIGKLRQDLEMDDLVHRYGKEGDAQRGIDLIGTLSGGARIVFQCKYHSPDAKNSRVGKTEADKAIKLAHEKYPEAQYYVLVTNSSFTPEAQNSLINAGWLKWGGEQLSDLLRTLPPSIGFHLIYEHFGKTKAYQLYPLGPDLLVSPKAALASRKDALAHRYSCIGRAKEIKALTKALIGNQRQAVILSGEGGLGKSRILCEVLSRLEGTQWEPRILQKMESSENPAKQVNLLANDHLVVGMDECHLDGYFREDVSLSILQHSKNGRLLLACRPEGLPKLRQSLRIQGWEIAEPLETSGSLKPLDKDSMTLLAEEILGKNHPQASHLANISSGNPLITVVGGEMLRNAPSNLREVIHSPEFRTQVFQHLEDSYLTPLPSTAHDGARRLLRLLAVLSPCSEDNLPSAAKLLGLTEAELGDKINQLRRAGLIRGTNENFRVIPDLFSDHLVRQALGKYDETGLLPRLLKSDLVIMGGTAIFRNVVMARWGSDSDNTVLDPVIHKLWESFRQNFTSAHDKKRSDLISSWLKWAIYLPGQSLELAQLALDSQPNPDPETSAFLPELDSHYRKSLESNAFQILSEIAKNHLTHQGHALELMWKHRNHDADNDHQSKTKALAEVFGPQPDRSIESPLAALDWLKTEAQRPQTFQKWTTSRTPEIAYYLSPAFSTQYEIRSMRGNVRQFGSGIFPLNLTAPLRQKAIEIIHNISPARARAIFETLRKDPTNHLQQQWFEIAVLDSGNLAPSFLGEWIDSALNESDLTPPARIIASRANRFAFHETDLVNRLLRKAQSISTDCWRKIEKSLIFSLINHAHSYTNGIPDDQIVLNQARKCREQHLSSPLLHALFDQVVRQEEAEAAQHRREFEEEIKRFRSFD